MGAAKEGARIFGCGFRDDAFGGGWEDEGVGGAEGVGGRVEEGFELGDFLDVDVRDVGAGDGDEHAEGDCGEGDDGAPGEGGGFVDGG